MRDKNCPRAIVAPGHQDVSQGPLGWAWLNQKRSGDPNPQYFSKSSGDTNGGRTAVQMGGVLLYKWEAYCGVSLSSKLRSQERTAIQMGGVLPYKWGAYCRTFQTSCRGWGFRNIAQINNFQQLKKGVFGKGSFRNLCAELCFVFFCVLR